MPMGCCSATSEASNWEWRRGGGPVLPARISCAPADLNTPIHEVQEECLKVVDSGWTWGATAFRPRCVPFPVRGGGQPREGPDPNHAFCGG